MIIVYIALAAVAVWCLARAMTGPAVRLRKVDRQRNEFMNLAGALVGNEGLRPEHNILLGYMTDSVADPDLPLRLLADMFAGRLADRRDNPADFATDLIAAQKLLHGSDPELATRVDAASRVYLQAVTGQIPLIGGLCRSMMARPGRLDMIVPGLVDAHEAARNAPAQRVSQEMSAA